MNRAGQVKKGRKVKCQRVETSFLEIERSKSTFSTKKIKAFFSEFN